MEKSERRKWRFNRRVGWILATFLPVPLFFAIYKVASWRPRRIAEAVPLQGDQDVTAKLGRLQGISNSRLFFLSDSGDTSSGYRYGDEDKTFLRVVNTDGQVRQTKLPWAQGDATLQILSDRSAIVWDAQWVFPAEDERRRVGGEIFDCQTMRFHSKLQAATLHEGAGNYIFASYVANSSNVIVLTDFEALEWSLKSGRLMRRWKLHLPKDDVFLTHAAYSPSTNRFVQVMANRVRTWDAGTGKLIRTSAKALADFNVDYGEGDPPSHVLFSPDAALVAYNTVLPSGSTGPVYIARCDTGEVVWHAQEAQELRCIGFSPDGRQVYCYSDTQHRFIVHEARTGKVLRVLQAPRTLNEFWISPDGNSLCSSEAGNIWWQRAR